MSDTPDCRPACDTPGGLLRRRQFLSAAALAGLGGGLAAGCSTPVLHGAPASADDLRWLDRIGWGADTASLAELGRLGRRGWLAAQLHPPADAALPAAVQSRIAALPALQRPMEELVVALEERRAAAKASADVADQRTAQQAYRQQLREAGQDAASRALLRALYSPYPLQERMTWFWCNHFNVYQGKANLRAMVGDYEARLRPLALGRFADLLVASATHAAMLRYLDNAQNAADRINENYARELMELHTLGLEGGYTQRDVQELARVLTGLGVRFGTAAAPPLRPALQPLYRRHGGMEFHPGRHDMADKTLLGQRVAGRGWDEVMEQLHRLARHPATARHVSHRLATYLAADAPPPALVDRMAEAFTASDGAIGPTLHALFEAPEFTATLGRKFKDPLSYLVSATRLVMDGAEPPDTAPLLGALNRMGQGLYNRQTPDGYPMDAAAWSGSGQMAMRFEVARAIVQHGGPPSAMPTPAQRAVEASLGPRSRAALQGTASPRERQWLLLCAPEFQYR